MKEPLSEEASSADVCAEQPSEADLIRRVLSGEQEEFRLLVEAHQTRVFSIIMKQVGNRAVADELALETFERAFFNLKSFHFRSRFSTWLTRIALNVTGNYFASRRYKEAQRSESFCVQTHDGVAWSGDVSERAEYFKRFHDAISRLSPKLRDVLTLCGFSEASYEEAAETLQIPVGTVRSRLNQARTNLRAMLEKEAI